MQDDPPEFTILKKLPPQGLEITVIKKGKIDTQTAVIKGDTVYVDGAPYCKMWEIQKWWM